LIFNNWKYKRKNKSRTNPANRRFRPYISINTGVYKFYAAVAQSGGAGGSDPSAGNSIWVQILQRINFLGENPSRGAIFLTATSAKIIFLLGFGILNSKTFLIQYPIV